MTAVETPRGVELMLGKVGPGWQHRVVHGAGQTTRKRIDPDLRKQVGVVEDVQSVSLRLRHDDGRAAIGIWVAEWTADAWAERKATKKLGTRNVLTPAHWHYGFDLAFAWQVCVDPECPISYEHPDDMPRQVSATELGELLAPPGAEVLDLFSSHDEQLVDERTAA